MRLELDSAVRLEATKRAESMINDAIGMVREEFKITHGVDIAFILNDATNTALVKDRVFNR